nr:ejaculatory bulb-specific protein 3-like isoform X3 [Plodia interpunctella]
MKLAVVILFVAAVVLADDKYEEIEDKFDLSEVLSNDRLLQSYAKCLLNKGPCTPEIKKIKEVIPEALETSCGKCTPKQKKLIKKVIKAVMDSHPDAWTQLVDKYDKDKKYRDNFNKFLQED